MILKCTQNSLYIQIMTFKGQRYTGTQVIEVKQLKLEVVGGLRGHSVSSEANMHARARL